MRPGHCPASTRLLIVYLSSIDLCGAPSNRNAFIWLFLPAELRALFHLMPIFWPRLWHSVIAIELTFPNWNRSGGNRLTRVGRHRPRARKLVLTSLIPPPLIREHTPPVKAVPLRPLWNVRPLKHRMTSNPTGEKKKIDI